MTRAWRTAMGVRASCISRSKTEIGAWSSSTTRTFSSSRSGVRDNRVCRPGESSPAFRIRLVARTINPLMTGRMGPPVKVSLAS